MYGKGHRVNLDLLLNLLNFFQNNEILQMICKYNVIVHQESEAFFSST